MTDRTPMQALERLVGGHAALCAAARTGVLERLARQPATAEALAEDAQLDARLLTRLLAALAALGVVEVDAAGRYRVAAIAPTVLDRLEGMYAGLPEALRGHPPADPMDSVSGAAARYPQLVGLLAETFADPAAEVAERLARPGLRILDAGAGGAPWSLALARARPDCHVVAVDLPEVLPATRSAFAGAGVEDRLTPVAGDVFSLPLRADHDLVVAGNLCHLFAPGDAAALVARLAGALRPGGTLAVVDVPGDPAVLADPATAVYALGLTVRTAEGTLHTSDDYQEWLADAGLTGIGRHPLDSSPLSGLALFTGQRPDPAGTAPTGGRP